jgi:hypothetical protein
MERAQAIGGGLGGNTVEVLVYAAEFFEDDGFQECRLAGEASVQRLLAHPEILSEIVHRYAAEPVGEKMPPGFSDDPATDSMSNGRA